MTILIIQQTILKKIHQHGEISYPNEGAGFLLGTLNEEDRVVTETLELSNSREDSARHNRYLITPLDYLQAEEVADRTGLSLLGVFHSHPDHPERPSEYDREWAMPWFSYLITSVQEGKVVKSRSWKLTEDRSTFLEEPIVIGEGVR